jgi:hypothetical protein
VLKLIFILPIEIMKLLDEFQHQLGEVNDQQKKEGFWLDVIDDIEVTKALLEKVYELGRKMVSNM